MLVYQDGELVDVPDDSVDSSVYGYDAPAYAPTMDDDAFNRDWADMMAGKYTFDEVASGDDIKSEAEMLQWASNASPNFVSGLVKQLGANAGSFLKKYLYDPTTGKYNMAGLTTAALGLYNYMNEKDDTGGYNKPVPKMEAVRERVQYDDAGRRPGEQGRKYFTDTQYVAQGDDAAKQAAQAAAATEASGLAAIAPRREAARPNPWSGKMNLESLKPKSKEEIMAAAAANLPQAQGTNMATGGIANLAKGGRYLAGHTDGMADKIPTSIDGKDPAALSHGEFVIPADVVSHLGNGNSEAGAKKLYDMMAKVRKARTGNEKQGKRINPDKFMPGGLAAAYAAGGAVKGFAEGGATETPAPTGGGGVPLDTSRTSTLSPWVGDYVTQSLGEGAALAAQPLQAYTGPLTAGPSNLQQQAFAGASELAQAGYTPSTYSAGSFDAASAQKYMNPYLSAALQPSLDEARRQAKISRLEDATRLTKAGAFGGSRQAIMESELNRNLMDKQNKMLTEGYATAYDKAMNQFNTEQGRQLDVQKADEASRQFGANFAVSGLKSLADLGATERAIEQEGIAADKAQFEEQRDWAYKMPQYKLNLLQGLPIGASTTTTDPDALAKLQSDIAGLTALYKNLSALGQTGS